jgi:hypothetical protein
MTEKNNNQILIYIIYRSLKKSRGLLNRVDSIQHSISRDQIIWQPSIQACVLVTSSKREI